MNIKTKLGLVATLAAILSVAGLSLGGGVAQARATQPASAMQPHNVMHSNTPFFGCSFQTLTGFYLTAVGGGGRTTDVIHTNATVPQAWEKFNLFYQGFSNAYAIQTSVTFNYLTAVSGGGRTTDVIESNRTVPQAWEQFNLVLLGVRNDGIGVFAIQTTNGHYLTAMGMGGRTTDTIHSDATRIGTWEQFYIACNGLTSPLGN